MAALLEALSRPFNKEVLGLVSDHIGVAEAATRSGIVAALPVLVGAVAAQGRDEAPEALDAALAARHDGTVHEHLTTVLERVESGAGLADVEPWVIERLELDPAALEGDGILDHLVGDRRERIALAISRGTDLRAEQANDLLAVLAPIVMSALGHVKNANQLDVEGLQHLLREERRALQSMLDADEEAPSLFDVLDADPKETLRVTTRIAEALRHSAFADELVARMPT